MHASYVAAGLRRHLHRHLVDPVRARGRAQGASRAPPSSRTGWTSLGSESGSHDRRSTSRGGADECAVAFAISEEVNSPQRQGTIELLARVFEQDPPDLILLETLTLVRDPETFETVELLLETGLPVWLSFRRCRHGVCGVYGQHWGPPEGDLFGRAARRFEEMGVGALLVNCLPVDHVTGMLSWLRDFTELPLGVYPNLGHLAGSLWRFDDEIDPQRYAELALSWRAEGAQIVGGCCGTTPEHIAAAAEALADTKPGRWRPPVAVPYAADELDTETPARAWLDERGRVLFPLPFPELVVDPGVFVPTQGSFLVWKHLFETGVGEGASCIDVGCGCGILAVQLALNGASSVHAIDIDRNAVANTLSNAFRNGVPTGSPAARPTSSTGSPTGASTSSWRACTSSRSTPSRSRPATARSTTGAVPSSTTSSACSPSCSRPRARPT